MFTFFALVSLVLNGSLYLFCLVGLELLTLSVVVSVMNLSFLLFITTITMCVLGSVLGVVLYAHTLINYGADKCLF